MAAAQRYAVELAQMPSAEFQTLCDSEMNKVAEEDAAKRLAQENSRFFNLPFAAADFDHWSRAAHWTLEEAVALSFGKNPEIVKWATIERWHSDSPFVVQYARLLDLARRAVPWQQLFDPVAPGIFIGWVRGNEIAFPQALEDAVRARGNHIVDWKRNYDQLNEMFDELKKMYDELSAMLDKTRKDDLEIVTKIRAQRDEAIAEFEALKRAGVVNPAEKALSPSDSRGISTRERDSLLKLVAGMAKGGYGFVPSLKRSEQVGEITSDLETAGVPLDADTVRKWLRASAELLPGPQDE